MSPDYFPRLLNVPLWPQLRLFSTRMFLFMCVLVCCSSHSNQVVPIKCFSSLIPNMCASPYFDHKSSWREIYWLLSLFQEKVLLKCLLFSWVDTALPAYLCVGLMSKHSTASAAKTTLEKTEMEQAAPPWAQALGRRSEDYSAPKLSLLFSLVLNIS